MNRKFFIFIPIFGALLAIAECCDEQMDKYKLICNSKGVASYTLPNYGPYLSLKLVCGSTSIPRTAPTSPLTAIEGVYQYDGSPFDKAYLQTFDGLSIIDARLAFFPRGIKEKFPNLRGITFSFTDLVYLDAGNLMEFGDMLQLADFSRNKLTYLEENLFIYNSNLVYVSFEGNPLGYIDSNFFGNLKSPRYLIRAIFKSAGCINQEYFDNDIESFVWNSSGCNDGNSKKGSLSKYVDGMVAQAQNDESCGKGDYLYPF